MAKWQTFMAKVDSTRRWRGWRAAGGHHTSSEDSSKPGIRRRRAPDGADTAFTVCGACAKRCTQRHSESCRGSYWSWFVVELMAPTLVCGVIMLLAAFYAKESTHIIVVKPEHEIRALFHPPPVPRPRPATRQRHRPHTC